MQSTGGVRGEVMVMLHAIEIGGVRGEVVVMRDDEASLSHTP